MNVERRTLGLLAFVVATYQQRLLAPYSCMQHTAISSRHEHTYRIWAATAVSKYITIQCASCNFRWLSNDFRSFFFRHFFPRNYNGKTSSESSASQETTASKAIVFISILKMNMDLICSFFELQCVLSVIFFFF